MSINQWSSSGTCFLKNRVPYHLIFQWWSWTMTIGKWPKPSQEPKTMSINQWASTLAIFLEKTSAVPFIVSSVVVLDYEHRKMGNLFKSQKPWASINEQVLWLFFLKNPVWCAVKFSFLSGGLELWASENEKSYQDPKTMSINQGESTLAIFLEKSSVVSRKI